MRELSRGAHACAPSIRTGLPSGGMTPALGSVKAPRRHGVPEDSPSCRLALAQARRMTGVQSPVASSSRPSSANGACCEEASVESRDDTLAGTESEAGALLLAPVGLSLMPEVSVVSVRVRDRAPTKRGRHSRRSRALHRSCRGRRGRHVLGQEAATEELAASERMRSAAPCGRLRTRPTRDQRISACAGHQGRIKGVRRAGDSPVERRYALPPCSSCCVPGRFSSASST